MAEWTDPNTSIGGAGRSLERAKTILSELGDATRSAAQSLADEQKARAAAKAGGFAEALRSAARSLDRSQNSTVARYADQAADRAGDFARTLRERRWGEIIADTDRFARAQPALFILGAIAVGFIAGRFLSLPANGAVEARPRWGAAGSRGNAAAVTAAISSGEGQGTAGSTGGGSIGGEPR